LKERIKPRSAEQATGRYYFMLSDGSLIGDDDQACMNHFEIMQKAIDDALSPDVDEDNFVFNAFYKAYGAIRINLNAVETNVQIVGSPTSRQLRSIAALVKRTEGRIYWDFGLCEKVGYGSIADFRRDMDEWLDGRLMML
jgi:hypothetical protein